MDTKKNSGTVLITAGPTREKIDRVRFISNESTGYLGYELALAAKELGYKVILILGPTQLPDIKGIRTVRIESARDLEREAKRQIKKADILFMTSAVADFTPKRKIATKLKRQGTLNVALVRTKDILRSLSAPSIKKDKIYVGFCLETNGLLAKARRKLQTKRLDFIVGTLFTPKKSPFGHNLFTPLVLDKNGRKLDFKPASKKAFAKKLLRLATRERWKHNT